MYDGVTGSSDCWMCARFVSRFFFAIPISRADIVQCGALAEFIVIDRHRCLRIPYPRMPSPSEGSPSSSSSSSSTTNAATSTLTLQEYALLPLCGVPAHRAVRMCLSGLSDNPAGTTSRQRVLVLRGHDGAGAFAAQMFVRHGWSVCVHVPAPPAPAPPADRTDDRGRTIEARVRAWGAERVVFDDGQPGAAAAAAAAVRVLGTLLHDGSVFDAIVDTVGGREVWEAGSRLLRAGGRDGVFATLVGDVVGRAVPSAGDHFRGGFRSFRRSGGGGGGARIGMRVWWWWRARRREGWVCVGECCAGC